MLTATERALRQASTMLTLQLGLQWTLVSAPVQEEIVAAVAVAAEAAVPAVAEMTGIAHDDAAVAVVAAAAVPAVQKWMMRL